METVPLASGSLAAKTIYSGLCFTPKVAEVTAQGAAWATDPGGVSTAAWGPGRAGRSARADSAEGDLPARLWGHHRSNRRVDVEEKHSPSPGCAR